MKRRTVVDRTKGGSLVQVCIWIPINTAERMRALCASSGKPQKQFCADAIDRYIDVLSRPNIDKRAARSAS